MHKSRLLYILIVSIFVLIPGGCAQGTPKEYTTPTQPIDIKAGEQFMITLDSNPTTGYSWEASFDKNMLDQVNSDYKQDQSKPGIVGVGGKHTFIFKGLKTGSTQIKLLYKRPWEQQSADAKTSIFNVTIK